MNDLELVNKFKPIYYIHSQEQYFPAVIKTYISLSTINKNDNGDEIFKSDNDLLSSEILAQNMKLSEYSSLNNDKSTLRLKPEYDYYIRGDSDLPNIPIYSNIIRKENKTYINYNTFFSYNHDYLIMGFAYIGHHYADIEHITVELVNDKISRIYFAQHSYGEWKNTTEFETEGDRPICYIAKGSHATYPYAGTYVRICGFANDYTEKGFRWDAPIQMLYEPSHSKYDSKTMGFLEYHGYWGWGHVAGISDKLYWKYPEQQIGKPYIYIKNMYLSIFFNSNFIIFIVIILFFIKNVYKQNILCYK